MSYNEKEIVLNEEQIAHFLQESVRKVEQASVTELQALNEIKALFKKNVPFSRRKYVAALLVKQATSGTRSRFMRERSEPRFNREEKNERFTKERESRPARTESKADFSPREASEREERPRPPRVQLDSSVSSTVFIGIGRNRRVFPRDLLGLLGSVAGIERERIGEIRVFTNYSFVQLYNEDCDKAISALNGYNYRGRNIVVSHSKQKPEDADFSEESSFKERGGQKGAESVQKSAQEESIPKNVTNEGHAEKERTEADKIAAEQSVFAAQQKTAVSSSTFDESRKPFAETTDDGQVKSHFGSGAAY